MKSCRVLALAVTFLTLSAAAAWASHDGFKGNGLPKGHKLAFNLEVIAYDAANCPSGDMIGTNTHRIAVKADLNDDPRGLRSELIRDNDILLTNGEFAVLDGNACIDGVAVFQLPAQVVDCATDNCVDPTEPDYDDPTFQSYEVFARLVGKPGTGVDVTTCATDELTDDGGVDDVVVCSTESYVEVREQGKKPHFTNQSKELLTICLDTTDNGRCDTRLALFDPSLIEYFWNWNTTGKAHAQLFFVAVPD